MEIKARCRCGTMLIADEKFSGMTAKCPACKSLNPMPTIVRDHRQINGARAALGLAVTMFAGLLLILAFFAMVWVSQKSGTKSDLKQDLEADRGRFEALKERVIAKEVSTEKEEARRRNEAHFDCKIDDLVFSLRMLGFSFSLVPGLDRETRLKSTANGFTVEITGRNDFLTRLNVRSPSIYPDRIKTMFSQTFVAILARLIHDDNQRIVAANWIGVAWDMNRHRLQSMNEPYIEYLPPTAISTKIAAMCIQCEGVSRGDTVDFEFTPIPASSTAETR